MSGAGINFGKPARVDATANVKTGQGKLWKLALVGGSAASTLKIYDATTTTGDPFIELAAQTGETESLDLHEENGIPFDTALRAVIAGSGAIAYLWYE